MVIGMMELMFNVLIVRINALLAVTMHKIVLVVMVIIELIGLLTILACKIFNLNYNSCSDGFYDRNMDVNCS